MATYRGWDVYRAGCAFVSASPYEMDWWQFSDVYGRASHSPLYCTTAPDDLIGIISVRGYAAYIDAFEAAREAMPATAFFGVEEEVLL